MNVNDIYLIIFCTSNPKINETIIGYVDSLQKANEIVGEIESKLLDKEQHYENFNYKIHGSISEFSYKEKTFKVTSGGWATFSKVNSL